MTDDTGAALPGVTVTATSPALHVGQLTAVTDGEGRYRFVDVPCGLYSVKFELQGFTTLVREGLQLNAGFAMRVDGQMKIGTLTDLITVSGAAPVVDLTSTRSGQTIDTDLLEAPMADVRGIAVLQVTPVQLVARAGSGILRLEDLRGKHVGTGSTRSASGLLLKVILAGQAAGKDIQQVPAPRPRVSEMMAAGELDAVFGIVTYSAGFASAIAEGAQLVPITGPVVDRLRREQPFLRTVLVPAGT